MTQAVEVTREPRRKGSGSGSPPPPRRPNPTLRRLRFKTPRQVLREAARSYWDVRDGGLERDGIVTPQVGATLARLLSLSLQALQTSTLEQRVADLEKALALAHATAKDGQEPS